MAKRSLAHSATIQLQYDTAFADRKALNNNSCFNVKTNQPFCEGQYNACTAHPVLKITLTQKPHYISCEPFYSATHFMHHAPKNHFKGQVCRVVCAHICKRCVWVSECVCVHLQLNRFYRNGAVCNGSKNAVLDSVISSFCPVLLVTNTVNVPLTSFFVIFKPGGGGGGGGGRKLNIFLHNLMPATF